MLYEYVHQNILTLLQRVGTLQRKQIITLFKSELSASGVQRILNSYVQCNEFKYDPGKDRYSFHSAPKVNEVVLSRRIDAFWVIANWGSENIISIDLLEYPSQYSVIDTDNKCYDITVCATEQDGELAMQKRLRYMIAGRPDDVIHIAVVYFDPVGENLRQFGFDSYATIDPVTHAMTYYTYD